MVPQPLTSRQESRLIGHLDSAILDLARKYNNRHAPNSLLRTLLDYLNAIADLSALVLAVPPVGASAHLRSAYALQLLSLLPDAVTGYNLPPRSQRAAFWARLARWDEESVAVLFGQQWDSKAGRARGLRGARASQLTGTERVRLRSLIDDGRTALEGVLGPTQFTPLEFNPFVPGSEAEAKLGEHPRPELTGRGSGEVAIEEGEEATPSLVSDAETTSEVGMDLDPEVEVTPDPSLADDVVVRDQADDDDDDFDDFEEVVVPETDGGVDYPSYIIPPSVPEAEFSISFQGPPTTPDLALPEQQHPPIPPSKGFDPDAEYPDSEGAESDGDDAYDPGEDVVESEAAVAVELAKARRVFEHTLAALAEVEGGLMQD